MILGSTISPIESNSIICDDEDGCNDGQNGVEGSGTTIDDLIMERFVMHRNDVANTNGNLIILFQLSVFIFV